MSSGIIPSAGGSEYFAQPAKKTIRRSARIGTINSSRRGASIGELAPKIPGEHVLFVEYAGLDEGYVRELAECEKYDVLPSKLRNTLYMTFVYRTKEELGAASERISRFFRCLGWLLSISAVQKEPGKVRWEECPSGGMEHLDLAVEELAKAPMDCACCGDPIGIAGKFLVLVEYMGHHPEFVRQDLARTATVISVKIKDTPNGLFHMIMAFYYPTKNEALAAEKRFWDFRNRGVRFNLRTG